MNREGKVAALTGDTCGIDRGIAESDTGRGRKGCRQQPAQVTGRHALDETGAGDRLLA